MKQNEFQKWLVEQGQTDTSASALVGSARRVEQHLGDLDELFAREDRDTLLNRFSYSAEDERLERPNPSTVPIDGVLRTGLASLQQALKLYHSFLTEQTSLTDKAELQTLLERITRQEVDAAMQECDQLGLKAFLARGGFFSPQNWVTDEGKEQTYPAKATVAAALGHLRLGRPLAAKEFFNGFGEAQSFARLEALGYRIIRKGPNGNDDTFSRSKIEGAMDAFDKFRESGTNADVFSKFDEPAKYWVRSTKPRKDKRFPTKPIVGFLLGNPANPPSGGWSLSGHAAARLHAAGYIIVDQNDEPLPLPEQYTHLMRGAERARLVAINYFIEPAREAGLSSVTIRAGVLHDICGLVRNWANVCQALEGEIFQKLASVQEPTRSGPERSTTTEYTFVLAQPGKDMDGTMPDSVQTATTNLILYGPPGTGKTYQTAWEAVRLCLGDDVAANLLGENQRDRLMAQYRRLMAEGRIEFVTFHQSMSYEEFVEGLRPSNDTDTLSESSAGFRLEPVAGIFQRIARRAEAGVFQGSSDELNVDVTEAPLDMADPEVDPVANDVLQAPPDQGAAGSLFTLGHLPTVRDGTFRKLAQDVAGQLAERHPLGFSLKQYREALVRAGRETGIEPTGGWESHNIPTWASHPDQGWLVPANATSRTPAILHGHLNEILQADDSADQFPQSVPTGYVLIIDEINRANISKVFGELITLLEPDKRLGRRDEIQLTLPYSKKRFGVPANLHIIGTMNTADRSIALLDTALRRRFTFKELMPNPSVLSPDVGGINLQKLLTSINDRIEYLFDREHQIGHAYFTGCTSRDAVEDVMRHKVIPLLSEYFYEDWSKVAAVLGDSAQGTSRFLEARRLAAPASVAADDFAGERLRWRVKDQFDFSEFAA